MIDTIGGPTVMLGWDTNRKTKPAMVSLMQKALKENYIKIRSKIVLAEMGAYTKTILYSKSGMDDNTAKMSAPPGGWLWHAWPRTLPICPKRRCGENSAASCKTAARLLMDSKRTFRWKVTCVTRA